MPNLIEEGKVVVVHYTLKDDDGTLIDSSRGDEPLAYLHGADNIVPGLEKQLGGKTVGDTVLAVVPPAEGYGDRSSSGPRPVPLDSFPEDVDVEPGLEFVVEDDNGNQTQLWVVEIEDDQALVDMDHPLAGVTLHFDVEIMEVRDATPDEKSHGHPHGPEGHAH